MRKRAVVGAMLALLCVQVFRSIRHEHHLQDHHLHLGFRPEGETYTPDERDKAIQRLQVLQRTWQGARQALDDASQDPLDSPDWYVGSEYGSRLFFERAKELAWRFGGFDFDQEDPVLNGW